MRYLTLFVILFLSGCSFKPVIPYDNTEKMMLTAAIGGQVADAATTGYALDHGCQEANPVFNGSYGAVLAGKVAAAGVIWYVANRISNHRGRKIFLGITAAMGLGVAAYNANVDCGRD